MPTFTLTNKAFADLKAIGRYTSEQWGREQLYSQTGDKLKFRL
ncbi:hypothetical protein ANAEL_04713 [Anaerolineales bacterium]|nr:hypothetical protein ANAEL_04713 [Anaerolineales bacterium]